MAIIWSCPNCDTDYTGDQHPLATGGWKCPNCNLHIVGGPIEQTNPTNTDTYAKARPLRNVRGAAPDTTPSEMLWR